MRYAILVLVALMLCSSAFAATSLVSRNGSVIVAVPASQYINVCVPTGSTARVYKQVGGPSTNMVTQYTLETNGLLTSQEVTFGPYTYATNVRIDADEGGATYSVGSGAVSIPCMRQFARVAYTQMSPATETVTATLTAPELMGGIITGTQSSGATAVYTLPTGTLMDTASGLSINQGFEWSLINLSTSAANTITLAAGSGHTIVGATITAASDQATNGVYGASSRWFTRKTAANTFVTYRIH